MDNSPTKRCYVLWFMNHRGKVSHEPTVFTTAAAAITEGERLMEKGIIQDYNFSVVFVPNMKKEIQEQIIANEIIAKAPKEYLTKTTKRETITL